MSRRSCLFRLRFALGGLWAATGLAAPVEFNLPAQSAADSLLAFSQQAHAEVLFAYDDLRAVTTGAVIGRYEPEDALNHLLKNTGFQTRRKLFGKFVITRTVRPIGSVEGRLLTPAGDAARGADVALEGTRFRTRTNDAGVFVFGAVPPGTYRLIARRADCLPLQLDQVTVEGGRELKLPPQTLQPAEELTQLDPFVVRDKSVRMKLLDDSAALLGPRRATGDLDLPRGENDVLPFAIYTRDQLTRSGVINLNEFLQRVILESDAASPSAEQSGPGGSIAGSTNLRLRSYDPTETIIMVNGRRLPEILTSGSSVQTPDVNFIPLSLIQQVEVLPASASALYNGNPVGGVINIVLRPDVAATELTTTYTNATGGYDAPQLSVSLQHGLSLLDGRLRLRFNAVVTATRPPVEAELGRRRAEAATRPLPDDQLYRATPNVRSADGSPLFGPGSASFTSVAPGADGGGGPGAFAGRAGVRNLAFFATPGGLADSLFSLESPYGHDQRRSTFFASVTYEPRPWLEIGLDATHSDTLIREGYQLLTGNLRLPAASPFNPFGRDVLVALNELPRRLGADYTRSRIDFNSLVGGVLFKLPADWRVALDAQYAHNVVKTRGLAGVDAGRWQQLVEAGGYNPLRDTQGHDAPDAFYDSVLVYRNGRGRTVTLGDYDTLDAAVRLTNQQLTLPTGRASLLAGADYRRNHLADYAENPRYGDGTAAGDPLARSGRTLQHYSFFAELQAPVLRPAWQPSWLHALETDLALRYVAADTAKETNLAPTVGLKAVLAGGFTFRGSSTISKRYPAAQLSLPVPSGGGPGTGASQNLIFDPVRGQSYAVDTQELINPGLITESAVTQTAGLIFQRGTRHRLRLALDFVDTRKANEIKALDAQGIVNVEAAFPDRVIRAPLSSGDTHPAGVITRVLFGSVNAAWRHSQNWSAAADYAWLDCLGGTLELRGRLLWFTRYAQLLLPAQPVVDQLGHPDGSLPGLLKYRANFGANWSNAHYSFGLDEQYFHSRLLPPAEQAVQGDREVRPYWQTDAYLQADLTRWLPGKKPRYGLRAQLRVNNLFATAFPHYVNEADGSGVQPYGDWRGRTYSLSLTAAF